MSDEIKDFLNKVDRLCYEYGFEIKPTHPVPNNEFPTISIIGGDEIIKLLYIDGEGIGVK